MKRKWVVGIAAVLISLTAILLLTQNMDAAAFMRELHGM